jgi:hypothetical protein
MKKYDRVLCVHEIYLQLRSKGRRQAHVKDASIVGVRQRCQRRQSGRAMRNFADGDLS